LIVDDTPENLRVLGNQIERARYDVALAEDGEGALQFLESCHPDLILLDLMMPGIDGYEVCRRIKENPATLHIPIIFLTARTELDDIVRGFEAGAVDYVCKPYQAAELLARVSTHIELKRSRETISRHNQLLHEFNGRLRALVQEKDEFLGIAAHDLNSPLQVVCGTAGLWRARAQQRQDTDLARDMERIQAVVERMSLIIRNLLRTSELESGRFQLKLTTFNLDGALRQVVDEHRLRAATKDITIDHCRREDVLVHSSHFAVVQALDNLVSNAVKFSPRAKTVRVGIGQADGPWVACFVADEGPGLTDQDKMKLFGKFARLSAKPTGGESSTGLGLAIVKKLIQAIGGEITVSSTLGSGTTFTIKLPTASPPSALPSSDHRAATPQFHGQ
jgi:signal transduction histidine kinase